MSFRASAMYRSTDRGERQYFITATFLISDTCFPLFSITLTSCSSSSRCFFESVCLVFFAGVAMKFNAPCFGCFLYLTMLYLAKRRDAVKRCFSRTTSEVVSRVGEQRSRQIEAAVIAFDSDEKRSALSELPRGVQLRIVKNQSLLWCSNRQVQSRSATKKKFPRARLLQRSLGRALAGSRRKKSPVTRAFSGVFKYLKLSSGFGFQATCDKKRNCR